MKWENKGNYIKNIEDKLIKIDVFIEGMDPIYGVPIEVSGLRSYELTINGENKSQSKKRKHQFSLIVDIHQDGTNKIVSFESQVIFTNSTEFDINIAHVFSKGAKHLKDELSSEEITEWYRNAMQNHKNINEYDASINESNIFEKLSANEEFRIPLIWFLEDIWIYYECTIDSRLTYRKLLPDLKKTFLLKKTNEKLYNELPKYHLFEK